MLSPESGDHVAQLLEHLPREQEDLGSIPALSDGIFPAYLVASERVLLTKIVYHKNKIIMPEVPSNLTFSNINQDIIYVTAGGSLYKVLINNK